MNEGQGLIQRETTAALRERSLERLQEGFRRYLDAVSGTSLDWRDDMINMTPFVDCARRLGHDPAAVLGAVSTAWPPDLRETFDALVRRSDVSIADFGWSVVDTPQGPAYRFEFPS
jgi:hypothetical protein